LSPTLEQAPDDDDDIDADPLVSLHAKQLIQPSSSSPSDKLQDSLASTPFITYECAADLTVTAVSSSATELIGVGPDRLLGNRTFWDERLMEEDRRDLLARVDRLRPGQIVSQTHRFIDDRGLPVWVAHCLRKVRTETDTIIRGCMIPLPAELQCQGIDSGVISQFVHKIGNHFQLINLLIGSLKRGVTTTQEIEALQQTVDRAVEFTRAFMHYSQTPTGLSELDLGEMLHSVIDANAPLFVERKVMFKHLVQESLNGALVNGDPILLECALHSILQNALDATSRGGRVVIKAKYHETCLVGQPVARVSVVDTGCGIETELLEKVTAPFFTSKPERDGLGLSIAARVVDLHGGLLNVSSTKGHGTEVEIMLPLRDAIDRAGR
jgi:signal transduction histidine kinase